MIYIMNLTAEMGNEVCLKYFIINRISKKESSQLQVTFKCKSKFFPGMASKFLSNFISHKGYHPCNYT